MSSPYHSRYYALLLSQAHSESDPGKLTRPLHEARIDLQPHQIDAAHFAFKNSGSEGVLLADEVGLGKTIEAGLIIRKFWSDGHRRVLCITPASLRQQWIQELSEKFLLGAVLAESPSRSKTGQDTISKMLDRTDKVVVCSYNFASAASDVIARIPWDLVVIDEAHRLRNVYKPGNKISAAIKRAVNGRRKILLTATPLQNNLLELFGLLQFVDPAAFGDLDSFKAIIADQGDDAHWLNELRQRISPFCRRTLRKQVSGHIQFTNRIARTQDFKPTDAEWALYEGLSEFLRRKDSIALPGSSRGLITLVIRKIMASSSCAVSGTLDSLINRLRELAKGRAESDLVVEALAADFETLPELKDERGKESANPINQQKAIDPLKLAEEIKELEGYKLIADSVGVDSKAAALLVAIEAAMDNTFALGGRRKAVIFTESRRTQRYLREYLEANGYAKKIVSFNGVNDEPDANRILNEWQVRHAGSDLITGSKSADTRAALIEEFRDRAQILIATESGAEGVNLQFCSLVVNYDLPWNPQRIEQRIGRCHRYGQKHDVVVLNFLNSRNAADKRVLELLDLKFHLFNGVFGASDDVLGSIESGVDIETRIEAIYQECRTEREVAKAFDELQEELKSEIEESFGRAKKKLFDNFDDDVQRMVRLKDTVTSNLRAHSEWLRLLAQEEIHHVAKIDTREFYKSLNDAYGFCLIDAPNELLNTGISLGPYLLEDGTHEQERDAQAGYRLYTGTRGLDDDLSEVAKTKNYINNAKMNRLYHRFHQGHPLALHLIERALERKLVACEVEFYPRGDNHQLIGKSGWAALYDVNLHQEYCPSKLLPVAILDDDPGLGAALALDWDATSPRDKWEAYKTSELLDRKSSDQFDAIFLMRATVRAPIAVPAAVRGVLQSRVQSPILDAATRIFGKASSSFTKENERLMQSIADMERRHQYEISVLNGKSLVESRASVKISAQDGAARRQSADNRIKVLSTTRAKARADYAIAANALEEEILIAEQGLMRKFQRSLESASLFVNILHDTASLRPEFIIRFSVKEWDQQFRN